MPLRNVRFQREGRRTVFEAYMDIERYGMDLSSFLSSCGLDTGMMRITPYDGSIERGPSAYQALYGGVTASVTLMDMEKGIVQGDVIPYSDRGLGSDYILTSTPPKEGRMDFALAGESKSAYVRNKVDRWLEENRHAPSIEWFDPIAPAVPVREAPAAERLDSYRTVLSEMRLRRSPLDDVQIQACLEGLCSTVQLMLGPPGTGKTNTASAAIMIRLAARPGNKLFSYPPPPTRPWTNCQVGSERRCRSSTGSRDGGIDVGPVTVLNIRKEPSGCDEITHEDAVIKSAC